MLPKNGCSGISIPGPKWAIIFVTVQRNDLGAAVRIIIGQEPTAGAKAVAGPGHIDVNLQDLNFEHVPGFGLGNVDRPGENMAAGALVLYLAINGRVIGRNVGSRNPLFHHPVVRAAGRKRLDAYRISGVNRKHGFGLGRVVAPDNGGRRSRQRSSRCLSGGNGCEREGCRRSEKILHRWLPME